MLSFIVTHPNSMTFFLLNFLLFWIERRRLSRHCKRQTNFVLHKKMFQFIKVLLITMMCFMSIIITICISRLLLLRWFYLRRGTFLFFYVIRYGLCVLFLITRILLILYNQSLEYCLNYKAPIWISLSCSPMCWMEKFSKECISKLLLKAFFVA